MVTSSPLDRPARLQTAKSFYILLFSSSRVFHNSHIRFTRRPHHRVYLYARLLIFTYLLSTGYVTPKSNFLFSHISFTNTMCRSSFRVCIGPPGLQLSQNTTLPFYFSQYSNKFSRISRFDKCERILRSFKLLLVNQQAPCTPSGCLWVLFTQIISAHIKFPQEIIVLTCAIFYTSYAITRRPYAPTSSLLGLGHHTDPSAPQH